MFLIIFSSLLLGAIAKVQDTHVASQVESMKFIEAAINCNKDIAMDAEALKKFMVWQVEETQVMKDFVYCAMTNSNISDKDGHLSKSRTLELLEDYDKKHEVELVVDECNTVQGSDPKDTLFKAVSCYHAKSPVIFALSN